MHLKFTTQGLWIYATMPAYLLALVGLLFIKSKKIGGRLYVLGLVLAVVSFGSMYLERNSFCPFQEL